MNTQKFTDDLDSLIQRQFEKPGKTDWLVMEQTLAAVLNSELPDEYKVIYSKLVIDAFTKRGRFTHSAQQETTSNDRT